MTGIIFGNIDIFFTLVLICLYLTNVFFVKDLFFRFLIFFCSEFVCIMNSLFIFYKQDNFLVLLLINIIFMLLIVYLLFYSKNNKEIIDMPISVHKKGVIISSLIFFVVIFLMITYSFVGISGVDVTNSNNDKLLVYNRSYIKHESGVDIKNEVMNIRTGKIDYNYVKHLNVFKNGFFLKKCNFLVISYSAFVVFMFFLSKSHKGLNRVETEEVYNEK